MAYRDPIVNLIVQGARRRGLDPNAVLAVARVEGLSGRVGDRGTSFGPFQLHIGGALPRGIANPRAWASSPAGINYALDHIAAVARGKRGRAAIAAIVSGFERPADIPGEIARASAGYGNGGGMALGTLPRTPRAIAASAGQPGLMAALSYGNELFGLPAALPTMPRPAAAVGPIRPAGNIAAPQVRFKRGKTIGWIEHLAAPFGLTVTATTGGKHVKGSYHYRGRAVDFGGNAASMAALAKFALQHPGQVTEMFYTGPGNPGYFIKDGRVHPNSQLDRGLYAQHTNHVHIAR